MIRASTTGHPNSPESLRRGRRPWEISAAHHGKIYNVRRYRHPGYDEFSGVSTVARMLQSATSMLAERSGDRLRDIAARYVGFAMIGCSVVLGELLMRADALVFGARSRP